MIIHVSDVNKYSVTVLTLSSTNLLLKPLTHSYTQSVLMKAYYLPGIHLGTENPVGTT